jgi:ribonucleoside-diphosphate reductase alpha chain
MPDVNEDFVAIARREGWYSDDLMQRIAAAGNIHFPEVPEKWQHVFVTAHDVTPEWHIRMQAAFQEYTDSAISKTCNFPREATEADVEQIYRFAYRLECKGVTVYRDASRENQVLSTGATATKIEQAASATGTTSSAIGADQMQRQLAEALGRIAELEAELGRTRAQLHDVEAENLQRRAKRSRPDLLGGTTRRIETGQGTMYVTITEDDRGQPFEVFISLGKAGAPLMADVEAIGRLISLGLRSGIPMREIYRQVRGISSDRVVGLGPLKVLSIPDAIGIAIEKWMQEKQGIQQDLLGEAGAPLQPAVRNVVRNVPGVGEGELAIRGHEMDQDFLGACPDCGSQLVFAEGCAKCHVCGYSECG